MLEQAQPNTVRLHHNKMIFSADLQNTKHRNDPLFTIKYKNPARNSKVIAGFFSSVNLCPVCQYSERIPASPDSSHVLI